MHIYIIDYKENIADLIKIGDFVNGYEIIDINYRKNNLETYLETETGRILDYQIKTILTKEQYQNNCYRMENKNNG